MQFRLTETSCNEILYEGSLPDDFHSEKGLEEQKILLDHRKGKAEVTESWFRGMHINSGTLLLYDDLKLKAETDTSVLEMHFSLSGISEQRFEGESKLSSFSHLQHNFYYMPYVEGEVSIKKQNGPCQFFEVHLSEEYFKRLANEDCRILSRMAEMIDRKSAVIMSKQNLVITPQMQMIIQEIINSPKKGVFKRLFLEAKVLELLMLQIEQYEENNSSRPHLLTIQESDMAKLHHAKFLVEQNLSHPLSLRELAHEVGLNDFKLKKGFKELFGYTVFGYLHELRMQEATRLLQDRRRSISEVAEYCGYEYVQHFNTAFKKKFGLTPGNYR